MTEETITADGIMPKQYKFKPHPDITAWEMAQVFVTAGLTVDDTVYPGLPPEVQRHFEKPES